MEFDDLGVTDLNDLHLESLFDDIGESSMIEIGESSCRFDQEDLSDSIDEEEILCPTPLNIIVEDLVPFVELCNDGEYDFDEFEDPIFPPGFEPDFDDVHVEDWEDSEDELHPEKVQSDMCSQEGFWVDSDEEKEPEQKVPWWFPKQPEPEIIKTRKFFKIPRHECVGRIIRWKYDNDNKVFIIKRTDGLQYFYPTFKALEKLPKCEVNHIASIDIINRSRNGLVDWMAEMLSRECNKGKYTWVKETFPRRTVDYFDIEPISNQPRVMTYPRVKCLRKIPLEKLPVSFWKFVSYWKYNGSTGEAEIACYDRDAKGEIMWNRETIVYVFDPLSLINLSKDDLEVLLVNPIIYDDAFDDEAMALKFQRVVEVCCAQGVHAGCNLPGYT